MADNSSMIPGVVALAGSAINGIFQVLSARATSAAKSTLTDFETKLGEALKTIHVAVADAAAARADAAAARATAAAALGEIRSLSREMTAARRAERQPTQPTLPSVVDLAAQLGVQALAERVERLEGVERDRHNEARELAGDIGRILGRLDSLVPGGGGKP